LAVPFSCTVMFGMSPAWWPLGLFSPCGLPVGLMATRGLEVGRIALGILMEMHSVFARRQVLKRQLHLHPLPLRDNGGSPNASTCCVFQLDRLLVDRLCLRKPCGSTKSEGCSNCERATQGLVCHDGRVLPRNRGAEHILGIK